MQAVSDAWTREDIATMLPGAQAAVAWEVLSSAGTPIEGTLRAVSPPERLEITLSVLHTFAVRTTYTTGEHSIVQPVFDVSIAVNKSCYVGP